MSRVDNPLSRDTDERYTCPSRARMVPGSDNPWVWGRVDVRVSGGDPSGVRDPVLLRARRVECRGIWYFLRGPRCGRTPLCRVSSRSSLCLCRLTMGRLVRRDRGTGR